ncbi:winged helix-turn-helix domain-containing protein [Halosimplex sp. TS25]|uniref:winged helix-turn-helix domain-containing protein n=1 Tax=Halosimplex rarum TaxID=3396619 RepID=UPI0039EBFCF7
MNGDDGVTPEAAFTALGNEIRLRILHVLADAAETGSETASFSDIYDQVDIDSTSQLAYHLDALDGIFVHNGESGYGLTQAGDRIVRTIRSGTYSDRPSFEPTTLDGQCLSCDATTLVAEYQEPFLVVDCQACTTRIVTYNLPPAESQDRTNIEILESCNRRVNHEYATALRGTCSQCGGVTDLEIEARSEPSTQTCVATCRQCRLRLYAPLEVRLLHHPEVAAFYWRHGVDVLELPLWDLPSYVDDWELDVVETDPFECRATIVYHGDSVQVSVDGDLRVSVRGHQNSPHASD